MLHFYDSMIHSVPLLFPYSSLLRVLLVHLSLSLLLAFAIMSVLLHSEPFSSSHCITMRARLASLLPRYYTVTSQPVGFLSKGL